MGQKIDFQIESVKFDTDEILENYPLLKQFSPRKVKCQGTNYEILEITLNDLADILRVVMCVKHNVIISFYELQSNGGIPFVMPCLTIHDGYIE